VHFSEGEPGFCGGRRAVCLALYLHVYTYVYHTSIFTYVNICISHMYIYIHTHMYITHQRHPRHANESPSRVPRRSCALSSAALLFQDAGECIDTHRKTCIFLARLERRLGAEEARVGMKTVMTTVRQR